MVSCGRPASGRSGDVFVAHEALHFGLKVFRVEVGAAAVIVLEQAPGQALHLAAK